MKRFLATVLLSGVLIMNTGMFCHSLCIGGHHEKAGGHQHSADSQAHRLMHHQMAPQTAQPIIHPMAHPMTHQMTRQAAQKTPQGMPHGEHCPMGQDMRQGKPDGAGHSMPETLIKCGCAPEDEASSAYEAALMKPIIADLTPHFKTVSTVTYQHTLFSSRGPSPVEGPPKLLS